MIKTHYSLPNTQLWQGRIDGVDRNLLRWHQVVKCSPLDEIESGNKTVAFLGFACDEGVKRNNGRVGAKEAPLAIRKCLCNLPAHFNEKLNLLDVGDVYCDDENLEDAQEALSQTVEELIKKDVFPIILGGGHEISYAHFRGLRNSTTKKIGIINFDAHFDLRELVDGKGNSGTGFNQIYQDSINTVHTFRYLALGIQQISNTKSLFQTAASLGAEYILAENFSSANLASIQNQVLAFINKVDAIYLTVDLDVFAAPFAPGVSAQAFSGLFPNNTFHAVFNLIINSPKLMSVDFAEVNPTYDVDNRTAKLAADLIFRVVQSR